MASESIEELANKQQMSVMTCHPEHLEMLKYDEIVEVQS